MTNYRQDGRQLFRRGPQPHIHPAREPLGYRLCGHGHYQDSSRELSAPYRTGLTQDSNLNTSSQNLTSAESLIRDLTCQEMTSLPSPPTPAGFYFHAAQQNSQPNSVRSLLG
jgi:hypothetical protein